MVGARSWNISIILYFLPVTRTSDEESALREKLDELSHIAAKFKLSVRTAQDLAVTSASQLEENLETCRDDRTQCMDDLEVRSSRNRVIRVASSLEATWSINSRFPLNALNRRFNFE